MNEEKSKLKKYTPLKDINLKDFFRSKSNVNYLIQKGFIDNERYIMYDKEYRGAYGFPHKLKSITNQKSNNLKNIKDLSMQNNINYHKSIMNLNVRTKDKLP